MHEHTTLNAFFSPPSSFSLSLRHLLEQPVEVGYMFHGFSHEERVDDAHGADGAVLEGDQRVQKGVGDDHRDQTHLQLYMCTCA